MAVARVQPGDRWIDGTFGRGGHSSALLTSGAQVLALDRDAAAEPAAQILKTQWPDHFQWERRNFEELKTCCHQHGWSEVDGVLLDLGVSSPQLETAERGFSFRADGPLDMRMDQRGGMTAADVVNERSEEELTEILYEHGGEREARRVVRALAARRRLAPFRTTGELAAVVAQALPHRRAAGVHPATKVFQALRIAVNREQEALVNTLPQALGLLKEGGRLAVISFHSGEDRTVKNFLRERGAEWLETPAHPNTVPNPRHHMRLADETRHLRLKLENIERHNTALGLDLEMLKNPERLTRRLAQMRSTLVPLYDPRMIAHVTRMEGESTRMTLARMGTFPNVNVDTHPVGVQEPESETSPAISPDSQ